MIAGRLPKFSMVLAEVLRFHEIRLVPALFSATAPRTRRAILDEKKFSSRKIGVFNSYEKIAFFR
jgi:hypothetical protein